MTERRFYARAALALLAVEAAIARFVHDRFVRPHLGDVLAVILVYCALRAVTRLGIVPAACVAVAIAFAIEFGQYFDLLHRIGLADNPIARVLLGSRFEVADLLAYLAGGAALLLAELLFRRVRRR